ncbi:hypothetical protein [Streptomyces sp. Go-475]|uniref:hypothetical protein n=1 Tax=Streptomyces sp. Go-475 TaxID=2072505 RepID=UPI000DF04428|nr:hypothetical protein [Streptomyces sp. Go-475]AXE90475.1 hypothetical protein C1703_36130 [Streptomyces sp. Go-475]
MDEHIAGSALQRVGDRGGVLDRHRQRAQHPEVLGLAHPQPKIRTAQIDSRMLQNQSQSLVLHEQFVHVERLDG